MFIDVETALDVEGQLSRFAPAGYAIVQVIVNMCPPAFKGEPYPLTAGTVTYRIEGVNQNGHDLKVSIGFGVRFNRYGNIAELWYHQPLRPKFHWM